MVDKDQQRTDYYVSWSKGKALLGQGDIKDYVYEIKYDDIVLLGGGGGLKLLYYIKVYKLNTDLSIYLFIYFYANFYYLSLHRSIYRLHLYPFTCIYFHLYIDRVEV